MAADTLKFAVQLVSKLPLALKVVLTHILGLSESSKYLGLRSNVFLAVLRSIMTESRPMAVGKIQAITTKDREIKGRIWVSRVVAEVPPETSIRDTLMAAIEAMKDPRSTDASLRVPDIVPIEAEWTGYRAAAKEDDELPDIPEAEKYAEMMKECTRKSTVLYFHGGAYYLGDPVMYRKNSKTLAKLTGGRVYSVRYRLAPQNPFPTQVLDALVSYFTLLYPPPGAVHEPVSPSDIVFSGDSAGGHMCLTLLQTLLEMKRQNCRITWFGQEREVPLPGGLALNSPWVDVVQSMPSWHRNQKWDYLPTAECFEALQPPADDVWPAKIPRRAIYADDAYLLHPLVSLQLNATWKEAPPIWMCIGWECLADEDRYLTSKLVQDGVQVVLEEYEAMPHVFAVLMPQLRESKRCLDSWAQFIVRATEEPQKLESSFKTIKAKTLVEEEIKVDKITPFSNKEMQELAYGRLEMKTPVPETLAKL